jgi:hypothetical protein
VRKPCLRPCPEDTLSSVDILWEGRASARPPPLPLRDSARPPPLPLRDSARPPPLPLRDSARPPPLPLRKMLFRRGGLCRSPDRIPLRSGAKSTRDTNVPANQQSTGTGVTGAVAAHSHGIISVFSVFSVAMTTNQQSTGTGVTGARAAHSQVIISVFSVFAVAMTITRPSTGTGAPGAPASHSRVSSLRPRCSLWL